VCLALAEGRVRPVFLQNLARSSWHRGGQSGTAARMPLTKKACRHLRRQAFFAAESSVAVT